MKYNTGLIVIINTDKEYHILKNNTFSIKSGHIDLIAIINETIIPKNKYIVSAITHKSFGKYDGWLNEILLDEEDIIGELQHLSTVELKFLDDKVRPYNTTLYGIYQYPYIITFSEGPINIQLIAYKNGIDLRVSVKLMDDNVNIINTNKSSVDMLNDIYSALGE